MDVGYLDDSVLLSVQTEHLYNSDISHFACDELTFLMSYDLKKLQLPDHQ